MLPVGALIGLVNGFSIARFSMPAFMVTLVTLMLLVAFAHLAHPVARTSSTCPRASSRSARATSSRSISARRPKPELKRRDILPFVTYPMLIALALAIVAHLLLSRTVFGRYVYRHRQQPPGRRDLRRAGRAASSSRSSSSPASAPPSPRSSTPRGSRAAGRRIGAGSALLDIIGATVIGGTSLCGGKGKIPWTFFGVVFFVLLSNTLNYMGLSAFHIDVVKGGDHPRRRAARRRCAPASSRAARP